MSIVLRGDDVRDALQEHISATIEYFLERNYYSYFAPIIAPSSDVNEDFFRDNKITPNESATLFERKMMSHLIPFYRDRIIYNPRNVDNMIWASGHCARNERCFSINACLAEDITEKITYQEWLELPASLPIPIQREIVYNIKSTIYDGIDILPDKVGIK